MNEDNRKDKNKKKAVAMKYNPQVDNAPVVVGKGQGHIADKIMELAKENHIPVQEDPSLVEALSQIDLNRQIPVELYQVVAEVMAFIYQTDQKVRKDT